MATIVNQFNGNIFRSDLTSAGALLTTSAVAYFVYLGFVRGAITPTRVEFYVTVAGAGAQTAEVGFFSTPAAPNKAGQSLTKLVSTGTVDTLTGGGGTGVKRNTSAFSTPVAAGVHLWAGARFAMATTQPTLRALADDMAQGHVLQTAGAGALTGAGPFAGAIVVATNLTPGVDLRGTLV